MPQSQRDLIRGFYDAFARGDIGAILSRLDERIDWRSPDNLPHGGSFSGRDAVGRFFQGIGEHWESLTVEVDHAFVDEDRVVVLMRARGRLRSGEETGYSAAHAWTLRDGVPIGFAETVDAPLTLPSAPGA
jgi:ketosteroid isomerase-like protein